MAKTVDVSASAINAFKAGRLPSDPKIALALADTLGVSPWELYLGKTPGGPAPDPDLAALLEAVQAIVSSNNRLVINALKSNLAVFLQAIDRREPRPQR